MAEMLRLHSLEQHHHFVGVGDIEVPPQQFAGKVSIRMRGIEQAHAIAKPVTLGG